MNAYWKNVSRFGWPAANAVMGNYFSVNDILHTRPMYPTVAGTSGLATAMTNFMNSPANVSGLTNADMTTFMPKLTASNGNI